MPKVKMVCPAMLKKKLGRLRSASIVWRSEVAGERERQARPASDEKGGSPAEARPDLTA